jgi:hypothetical protein
VSVGGTSTLRYHPFWITPSRDQVGAKVAVNETSNKHGSKHHLNLLKDKRTLIISTTHCLRALVIIRQRGTSAEHKFVEENLDKI